MATIAVTIMGFLEFLSTWIPALAGNTLILGLFAGYVVVLFAVLSGLARCGRLPNPVDPTTWPPRCCPGSKCP